MIAPLIITFFVALLTAITAYIAYKFIVITRVKIPETPNLTLVGSNVTLPDSTQKIPSIIWSYWHEPPAPALVAHCQDNWQRMAPDHEIRMLDKNNFLTWITADTIPDYFYRLPPYRQADWLRIQLLAEYGGIWIDASTILTQNLQWAHTTQEQCRSEYVGFYMQKFTSRPTKPIIENWFMAATPKSEFVKNLALELDHAIAIGETAYLAELSQQGKFEDVIQLITPKSLHSYLIMHVAASALLDKNSDNYRLALFCAEDTAFAFQTRFKWSKRTLHFKLALTPCPKNLPAVIKLRGPERDRIGGYLAKGLYYRGSVLAKFLNLK